MKWTRISPICLQSEDKQWVIAKYKVRGEWLYQLTKLGSPSKSVHIAGSADECKRATEGWRE